MPGEDEEVLRAVTYQEYFARGLAAVQGFITPGAAAAVTAILDLQARAGIGGTLAEIGTFHGKTFVGLALAARRDEAVVGVDLFVHQGQDFEATLRGHCSAFGIDETRYRLHRGPSTGLAVSAWRRLLGTPARFVHVDGEHGRGAVRHDLALAAAHLAPGGVILVDDVFHPWFPNVTAGVMDVLEGRVDLRAVALLDRQGPLIAGGPKLLVTSAEDEALYKEALVAALRGNLVGEAGFLTSRPAVFNFDEGVRPAPPAAPAPGA
ncbi:class I SAM-dependent methyltransferase [Roseomonas sp. PWR1]|uniref:Class I SAM-dependent methyltransferase n=1 Tax=Roseomonas nitratireducens TaxID=2820810 RepID=A0ABS4ATD2_9PROT|nr:class I SAM-dependent methyltransferase [Neoroseomonas nitratireducens]MBP0464557.1 class I SAM-dependent methyltransferase [Neoroseomonas nitratireducens]